MLNKFLRPIFFGDEQVRGPVESFVAEPAGGEPVAAVLGKYACDRYLVGLG